MNLIFKDNQNPPVGYNRINLTNGDLSFLIEDDEFGIEDVVTKVIRAIRVTDFYGQNNVPLAYMNIAGNYVMNVFAEQEADIEYKKRKGVKRSEIVRDLVERTYYGKSLWKLVVKYPKIGIFRDIVPGMKPVPRKVYPAVAVSSSAVGIIGQMSTSPNQVFTTPRTGEST
jgi:hypothetical protein